MRECIHPAIGDGWKVGVNQKKAGQAEEGIVTSAGIQDSKVLQ